MSPIGYENYVTTQDWVIHCHLPCHLCTISRWVLKSQRIWDWLYHVRMGLGACFQGKNPRVVVTSVHYAIQHTHNKTIHGITTISSRSVHVFAVSRHVVVYPTTQYPWCGGPPVRPTVSCTYWQCLDVVLGLCWTLGLPTRHITVCSTALWCSLSTFQQVLYTAADMGTTPHTYRLISSRLQV